jgi:MerR family transcriptional regulator, light-induced transcriptional regulator
MKINDHYDAYLASLLRGDRAFCANVVRQALAAGMPIKALYSDLFHTSLYQVGQLWQTNQISVAAEHLATATTESVMSQVVAPTLFSHDPIGRSMIVACIANEFHQIGGRMVADISETKGWDTYFMGANTPMVDLLNMIEKQHADVLALSIAVFFNLPTLRTVIEEVRRYYPDLPIWLGGQMFCWGGHELSEQYSGVSVFSSLNQLEIELDRFGTLKPLISP